MGELSPAIVAGLAGASLGISGLVYYYQYSQAPSKHKEAADGNASSHGGRSRSRRHRGSSRDTRKRHH